VTTAAEDELFIVMVDDDREDVYSMRRAFSACTPKPRFAFCSSGEELFEVYGKSDAPTSQPDLLLLDLNLPKMNGIEILHRLRHGEMAGPPTLTPVMVLSTSSSKSDISRSYSEGANAFFTKADDFAGTKDIAASILSFWQTKGLHRAGGDDQNG
jgi:CheY-like chemotaxis protein